MTVHRELILKRLVNSQLLHLIDCWKYMNFRSIIGQVLNHWKPIQKISEAHLIGSALLTRIAMQESLPWPKPCFAWETLIVLGFDSYPFAMNRLNEATMVLGAVRRPWHRSGHLVRRTPPPNQSLQKRRLR